MIPHFVANPGIFCQILNAVYGKMQKSWKLSKFEFEFCCISGSFFTMLQIKIESPLKNTFLNVLSYEQAS